MCVVPSILHPQRWTSCKPFCFFAAAQLTNGETVGHRDPSDEMDYSEKGTMERWWLLSLVLVVTDTPCLLRPPRYFPHAHLPLFLFCCTTALSCYILDASRSAASSKQSHRHTILRLFHSRRADSAKSWTERALTSYTQAFELWNMTRNLACSSFWEPQYLGSWMTKGVGQVLQDAMLRAIRQTS